MEVISSRKNAYIQHIRCLSTDKAYREEKNEYVCDGMKLLSEAIRFGSEIRSVLWRNQQEKTELPDSVRQYVAQDDLFEYASPLKNSPGPVFAVAIPSGRRMDADHGILVLENVQDPGNVGTVIRTANAFQLGTVILTGDCADLYHPKTVRATMGAIFRQNVVRTDLPGLKQILLECNLPLYGAALSDKSIDIRSVLNEKAVYAVGSEGKGLSDEILSMCKKQVIIPMNPDSESLNAAVAASVIMWEISGRRL